MDYLRKNILGYLIDLRMKVRRRVAKLRLEKERILDYIYDIHNFYNFVKVKKF